MTPTRYRNERQKRGTQVEVDWRREAGAKGGRARTKPKLAALRSLHAMRRGKRLSESSRERDTVLAEVATAVREPVRGERSCRVVADWCRVSDRTVRRWLTGVDWPPLTQVRRLAAWLRTLSHR